jgi:NADH:ubiquinone oxidoreductase subunit E
MQRGRQIWTKGADELLLSKLRQIQKKDGFLSEKKLKNLSLDTGIHITKIYEVATFYSFFNVDKKGKHVIRLCNSPSCLINGTENIAKIFSKILKIKPGQTTKDKKFTLEYTSCIGCCNESPAALVDGKAHTNLNEKKIKEIIKKCK